MFNIFQVSSSFNTGRVYQDLLLFFIIVILKMKAEKDIFCQAKVRIMKVILLLLTMGTKKAQSVL